MVAAILDVDLAFAEARKLGAARAEEILSGPDMLTDAAIGRLIGVKREAVRAHGEAPRFARSDGSAWARALPDLAGHGGRRLRA